MGDFSSIYNAYIAVFIIGYLGAITPGPDILLTLRYTLTSGARKALIALSGIASGWLLYLGLVYFGFMSALSHPVAQGLIGVLGGLYLGHISYKILRSSTESSEITELLESASITRQSKSALLDNTFLHALFVNLSNPKAILFFIIVVAPFANDGFEIGLIVLFCSLLCGFLSVIFVGLYVRKWLSAQTFLWIDRVSAVIFVGFAWVLLYQGVSTLLGLFG